MIALVLGACVIGFIGTCLMFDGKTPLVRIMGLWVVLMAGGMLTLASPLPSTMGWIKEPPAGCTHMVKVEGAGWTCAKEEELG